MKKEYVDIVMLKKRSTCSPIKNGWIRPRNKANISHDLRTGQTVSMQVVLEVVEEVVEGVLVTTGEVLTSNEKVVVGPQIIVTKAMSRAIIVRSKGIMPLNVGTLHEKGTKKRI